MEGNESEKQQFIKMTSTPIPGLITSLALPTIISMLITSIYNLTDTFFVSKLGTSAAGAVGIIMPLMAIIQTVGFTLGMGAGGVSSRLLGQRKNHEADIVTSISFFTSIVAGLIIAILGIIFINPLMKILGATDTILPYAKNYSKYILLNAPIMCASFVMNNNLRAEGMAAKSAFGLSFGAILNAFLAPLFIFKFNMGISGAAIATIISQITSFCILLSNYVFGHSIVKISIKNFLPRKIIYRKILSNGMRSFFRQTLSSIATVALNVTAAGYGDSAVAAISIVSRVFMFVVSALFGFGQGFQPVAGYNYGAGRYDRLKEAFWFCIKVGVVGMTILGVLGFVFSTDIMKAFRKEDADVIVIGAKYFCFQCMFLPFQAVVILSNILFQSTGNTKPAAFLSIARQGLFFLPLIFILPRFF